MSDRETTMAGDGSIVQALLEGIRASLLDERTALSGRLEALAKLEHVLSARALLDGDHAFIVRVVNKERGGKDRDIDPQHFMALGYDLAAGHLDTALRGYLAALEGPLATAAGLDLAEWRAVREVIDAP